MGMGVVCRGLRARSVCSRRAIIDGGELSKMGICRWGVCVYGVYTVCLCLCLCMQSVLAIRCMLVWI